MYLLQIKTGNFNVEKTTPMVIVNFPRTYTTAPVLVQVNDLRGRYSRYGKNSTCCNGLHNFMRGCMVQS